MSRIDKEVQANEAGVPEHYVENSLYDIETGITEQDIRADKIYTEILENIRLKIISEYGSIAQFCREKGFCKYTLSKVFTRAQNLSLTHYIRIMISLGVLPPDTNTDFDANLTVVDYLKINHNSVTQSFMTMIIG